MIYSSLIMHYYTACNTEPYYVKIVVMQLFIFVIPSSAYIHTYIYIYIYVCVYIYIYDIVFGGRWRSEVHRNYKNVA